jgi:hypothetical protein
VFLQRLLDLLDRDLQERPVATRIIDGLVRRLVERLHKFSDESGFAPESLSEFELILDELFGSTLSVLKATSIHSNLEALSTYKGYWHDPDLGPFFRQKNDQFLARKSARTLLRVFVCDSLASAVAEEWFGLTVVHQVVEGADVKVVEIDQERLHSYEDFGIYQHGPAKASSGTYVLLASRNHGLQRRGLATSITADLATVETYSEKFQSFWEQSAQKLEILQATVNASASGHFESMEPGESSTYLSDA